MQKVFLFFLYLLSNFLVSDDLENYFSRLPMQGVANNALLEGEWPVFHGSYLGYSYSSLKEINKENVNLLSPSWMHQPGKVKTGLQSTPIVADEVIYYIAPYNVVFAIDAYTGEQIWKYSHDFSELRKIKAQNGLDENKILYAPFSKGLAVGEKFVFFGSLDGQAVALDKNTGEVIWNTKILDIENCNCLFNSPPVIANQVVIFGPSSLRLISKGAIYGLNINTGQVIWKFETLRDHPNSWLPEQREVGGGFPWMPGTYDPELDLVYYPIGNPAPDWDDGDDRPGDNLYSSSIVALNPNNGKLIWYHQQVPHDTWDFDASGEFIFLERNGKKLMSTLNKNGYVYVYDRKKGVLNNIWKLSQTANWGNVNLKTGEITDINKGKIGEKVEICPWVGGARGWGVGSYSPDTKLWYTMTQDYCNIIEVKEKVERVPGNLSLKARATDLVYKGKPKPRLVAVDPSNGKIKWTKEYQTPIFGAVLTTAGGLIFHGNSFGEVFALDIKDGSILWNFNTGSGNRAGIISYQARGEQFILFPTGCCGAISRMLLEKIDNRFANLNEGAMLIAFKIFK